MVQEMVFLIKVRVPPGMSLDSVESEVKNSIGFGRPVIQYLYTNDRDKRDQLIIVHGRIDKLWKSK